MNTLRSRFSSYFLSYGRKISALVLTLFIILLSLSLPAAALSPADTAGAVRLAALKGPTGMGAARWLAATGEEESLPSLEDLQQAAEEAGAESCFAAPAKLLEEFRAKDAEAASANKEAASVTADDASSSATEADAEDSATAEKTEAEAETKAAEKGKAANGKALSPEAVEKLWASLDMTDYSWPQVDFSLYASPDLVVPLLAKGEVDLAMLPSNVAAQIAAKMPGEIRQLAVTTRGTLYLVERGQSVQTLDDLRGRTIVTAGKGANPEQILRKLLQEAGLDAEKDLQLEFVSEHQAVVAELAKREDVVALLPEPFVTVAGGKVADLRVALDLNAAYEETVGTPLVMGVLVGRSAWLEEHSSEVPAILEALRRSVALAVLQPEKTAESIGSLGILEAGPAAKALPRAGLAAILGEDARAMSETYLQSLGDDKLPIPDAAYYYLP